MKIQNYVVSLHGYNSLKTLKELFNNPEDPIAKEESIERAVNYIACFGEDPEAKQIAIELAARIRVISPEDAKNLSA